jgi:hypothetical protein
MVQLNDLLAKGWIRPSKYPYGARFYLYARRTVPCVRALTTGNSTTLHTPLPRIDELLDSLYGAHYFSTLDM